MTFPPPGDVFVFMIFPSSRSHQYTYRARVFFPGPRSYVERRETRVSKRIIIITINEPRTHLVWGGWLVCVPPLTRAICRVRKSMCIIWKLFRIDGVPERHPGTDPGPGNHIRENTAGLYRRESDDNFVVDMVFLSATKYTQKTTF